MTAPVTRTLQVIEFLAERPEGASLAEIVRSVPMPKSAAHRMMSELIEARYVRQLRVQGEYVLTPKIASIGLSFLSRSGVIDITQPTLTRLADLSGELVRLAVTYESEIVWVARAQGAKTGLLYEPDTAQRVLLSCMATGHAWLSTFPDEQAIAMVAREGFAPRSRVGPEAPSTVPELLKCLHAARRKGYGCVSDSFARGMAAMAAPIGVPGRPAEGVITIAGPSNRLTPARMQKLGAALLAGAREIVDMGGLSLHRKKRS